MTGYSRPVVFRALKKLIELSVIERHNRFGTDSGQDSNLYRILIADCPQPSIADDTGEYRTRYGGGIADDTGPSTVHDTLTNPLELTHLRKGDDKEKTRLEMTDEELKARRSKIADMKTLFMDRKTKT